MAAVIVLGPEATPAPCKRAGPDHVTVRNKAGQCILCLRVTRGDYNRRLLVRAARAPQAAHLPTGPRVAPALPQSFLAVANEYLAKRDDLAAPTLEKRRAHLALLRALHDRPVDEITLPETIAALEVIEALGDRRETAHRCKMIVQEVLTYAAQRGYSRVNVAPAGAFRRALKPIKVESHAAITDPARFGRLLRTIDIYQEMIGSRNHPSVCTALRLAPLVFVRPGELRNAEWSEVNLDKAEWVIPAARMKMRRPHLVPLSTQALAILREQHAITGAGRYVFPSKGHPDKPLSDNGFREALRMVLFASQEPRDSHTMHGFRSSASTLLNGELRIDSALVELQLAHAKGDKVAGIYDRSQHVPERAAMMQSWADYLDGLVPR